MTAFDLADVNYDTVLAEEPDPWPTYEEDEIPISTKLQLHDNGTVTISFLKVPVLDVDDLLVQIGSPEVRLGLLETLGALIAERLNEGFEAIGLPPIHFPVGV